jgi:hypothetical protein
MTTEEYAKEYLFREIREIETTNRLNVLPELSVYEKAIIYKYSEDGYEDLNEKLRLSKGEKISIFGILLEECLLKLPDYKDIVYRGNGLSQPEFDQYYSNYESKLPFREHCFFSTSKSKAAASEFNRGKYRVLFTILSKTGKEIESIAKYSSEREVLFNRNTEFKVIYFRKLEGNLNSYFITIKEI